MNKKNNTKTNQYKIKTTNKHNKINKTHAKTRAYIYIYI